MHKRVKSWLARISLVIFAWLVTPSVSYSQSEDWRNKIDRVVQLADSLALQSQYTFHLNKFDRKDRQITEAWHYTLNGPEVIIFEVHYFINAIEHDEVYYLDEGQLVCMEEYEIMNPFTDDDEIIWGSVGFYSRQTLRQHITMGKPDYPNGSFSEWEALKKFRNRYKELTENRTLMERNTKGAIFAP